MVDWARDELTGDEEKAVAAFMKRVAHLQVDVRLPDPSVVWFKAQLLKQWEVQRTVQAPLDVMEPLHIAAGLVAAALLFSWSLPSLLRLLPM